MPLSQAQTKVRKISGVIYGTAVGLSHILWLCGSDDLWHGRVANVR